MIILIAYAFKVLISSICGPWSSTCRTTSDFFGSFIVRVSGGLDPRRS